MADAAELVKRLEEGVQEVMSSDGWRRFLATQAKFHNYSSGNALLILVQNPEASQVAGFSTWREMGRSVKKGEHGLQILAPIFPRRDAETQKDEGKEQDGQSKDADEHQSRGQPVRFRVAHVFDVAQTEGKELAEPPIHRLEGDSDSARWLRENLLRVAEAEGVKVVMDATDCRGANGFYNPLNKEIHIADGLAPDQVAKTLAHEMAHHFLEHGRGRGGDRSHEEAEAEGTAFVLCSRYGLNTSDYSMGYVAVWASRGQKEAIATVKEVSATIQRVSSDLITRLEPELKKERAKESEREKAVEHKTDRQEHRHRTTREPATVGLAR